MSKDDIVIRCLNCGTKNRIPEGRFHDRPVCGKCRALLDEIIIRCLRCGTKNRMPETRLNDLPLCGKCGNQLVIKTDEGHPVDVTDATFAAEVLSHPGAVLVDCWAPWCGPCRTMAPVMDDLAAMYAGGVKVAKLNVDENPQTASRYGIRSIPTMLIFKDGEQINTLVGALPKETIEQHILSIMKKN